MAAVSGGFEGGKWFKIGSLVVIEGLVKSNNFNASKLIATLPEGCRPSRRLIYSLDQHGATFRVDVVSNGQICWYNGNNVQSWISLSGIVFVVD